LVAAELSYIVNDCQSQLLIFGPEYADVREELAATTAIPHQFSLAEYEGALAMAEPGPPPVDERIGPESIHCILYTSGTTGRPKGALISGRQVVWNCINTVVSWGLTADDVSPVFTPMFHAGGLFAFLTPIFYAGGRILLSRAFDPELTLKQIEDEGCTVILGVPTLFQLWLKSPQLARTDFSRVRYFISGGAPCPVPLMQAWRE
ncbi:MAG: AMP-binding protein, partial [Anaerolineae bacterium]|nr:AMP-binding protein [Anaerolineae bacterium]